MFNKLLKKITTTLSQNKKLQEEADEFRALKIEINKARCVIEFNAEGTITAINKNTLASLQYEEAELLGKHHRILVSRETSTSPEYALFWDNLSKGVTQSGSFKLQDKNGKLIWMQGYYAPVRNQESLLRKVVVYLTDITATNNNLHLLEAEDEALNLSFGVVECKLDMTIIECNNLFANPLGFTKNELVGKPITSIVSPEVASSKEYRDLWEALARGERRVTQIKRVSKTGKEFWYQGTYSPIKTPEGKPFKVIIYSVDITEEKNRNTNYEGQILAISRAQSVLEMDMQGTIINVNPIFCEVTGYEKEDIVGKHHSTLINEKDKTSNEYKLFWGKLTQGEAVSGEFKRIQKNGKEIWLRANYNPILDLNKKPFKIFTYSTEITKDKTQASDYAGQIEAISKLQGVIEFDLTGKITAVNDNFGHVVGYSENEMVGKHHSMFVDAAYKASAEYKAFWENLAKGEAQLGQFKRIGKGGKEVWLQANYSPILDLNGKAFKVVKYATDISEQHRTTAALETAVEETQGVIEGAKSGDLTSRVSLDGKAGAIASLCDGVNALMDKMTEIVVQVREAGETINTAAGEISSGNTDLSVRTEQQASSLEQTASSMEELASTVKQNSENAKQANQLAVAASGVAVKGGEVVGQVVDTMSAINSSAKKIEDIISVIDGIAFQTNILALNAAVEAARAGEQGRGFAVVAGEVRNLAQRSASAAKEIKELITDSVSKTTEGTLQVETAGKTMQEIVSSVQRVTDIMGEITAASVEQSAGIDLVNDAITKMDEATQQNAALVEEAAAAAESLVEQSTSLMDTVNEFRLGGLQGHHISTSPIKLKPLQSADKRSANSKMRNSTINYSHNINNSGFTG